MEEKFMQGRSILKTSGVLLIVFASLSLLSMLSVLPLLIQTDSYISLVAYIIGAGVNLATGIISLIYCDKPSKARLCEFFAILSIVVSVICYIVSSLVYGIVDATSETSLVSLVSGIVLPVLIIIGAYRLRHPDSEYPEFPDIQKILTEDNPDDDSDDKDDRQ